MGAGERVADGVGHGGRGGAQRVAEGAGGAEEVARGEIRGQGVEDEVVVGVAGDVEAHVAELLDRGPAEVGAGGEGALLGGVEGHARGLLQRLPGRRGRSIRSVRFTASRTTRAAAARERAGLRVRRTG